jgi:hypothetical protein
MEEVLGTLTPVPTVKHCVVWYGPVFDDIYDCPVDSRDPEAYELDEGADCFSIYDRLELEWKHEGAVVKLRSEQVNFSPLYVPGGEVVPDDERAMLFAPDGRLSSFMTPGKVEVVRTRYRSAVTFWRPIEVVILPAVQPT